MTGGAPSLSVVLLGAAADAPLPSVPGDVELVVVEVVDAGWTDDGADEGNDGDAAGEVRRVRVGKEVPFGAAASRGVAGSNSGAVVVLAGPAQLAGDVAALAPLLARPAGPSALLPQVTDTAGRLLEAGASILRDGSVVPVPVEPEHAQFGYGADATGYGAIAVDRSSFSAVGGFHPLAPDPPSAIAELILALGRRVTGVPAWVHPAFRLRWEGSVPPTVRIDVAWLGSLWPERVAGLPAVQAPATPNDVVAARDAAAADRILLVASAVPSSAPTLRGYRTTALVDALVELWPTARVTLLAADGAPPSAEAGPGCCDSAPIRSNADRWADRGVEVVRGPREWGLWFEQRIGHYTHVIATSVALEHRYADLLARTQPQAARILAPDGLEFRRPAALSPAVAHQPGEARGLGHLTSVLRARVEESVLRADAVWCTSGADRSFVQGLAPGLATAVLPGTPAGTGRSGQRRDVVVLAFPGADVTAGHEDAAVVAAREVFPLLRAADPQLSLRVLTNRPSALLLRLADLPGVVLTDPGPDLVAAFRGARLVLAPYRHGIGGRDVVALAVAAGTPFVTTELGAQGSDLEALAAETVAADLPSLGYRARRLLGDEGVWRQLQAAVRELSERSGPLGLRAALIDAGADLGIVPPGSSARALGFAPVLRRPAPTPVLAPSAPPPPPLDRIPPGRRQPRRTGRPPRESADEQYQRWLARFGPSEQSLAQLAAAATAAAQSPTFSILMPTYNTDPDVLEAAIGSVAAQVYPRWELCVADDASTSPATGAVLDRWAAADDRVRVTYLSANTGISGATNAALALATGEYVGFLDHDDELKPHALAAVALLLATSPDLDVVYTDEDKRDGAGRLVEPFFKPDWSPDQLLSRNYVNHLTVIRRRLVEEVGGLRSGYEGSQDYDLLLRVTEVTERVGHVPEPLYTWRRVAGSTAAVVDAKPYAFDAAKRALEDALVRRGTAGRVEDGLLPSTYRVRYDVAGTPLVSILIPTRDRVELLRRCIDSVRERSTYGNYEITVVDNQSTDPETLEYLATFDGPVVRYPYRFNYPRIMNLGGWTAAGDQLLFLNNDTEVISADWIEALLEHAQRREVGAVGCRLLYPDDRVQHEGIIVNYAAGHAGNVDHGGWWGFGSVVRNCTAVTGAVTMMRSSVFAEVGGFDERLRVAWNDVDLCLRVRQAGYRVVYTPYAQLYHHESASRGFVPHPEDDALFDEKWGPREYRDPYYNPNLDRSYPFRIYS